MNVCNWVCFNDVIPKVAERTLSAPLVFFLGAMIQRSGSLIMTSPLASYSEVPQTTCEGEKMHEKRKKNQ